MITFDVVIVGTGFGGAVCGARLAARGMRTLMLERGPWWGPAGEGHDAGERRAFPRGAWGSRKFLRNLRVARGRVSRDLMVNTDGLFEVHLFDALSVITGSGVGGGSLVYTSILRDPEDAFFTAFPPEITASEMRPYYARVRAMLRPRATPHPSEKSAAFCRAAAEVGYTAERPELAVAFGERPDRPVTIMNAAGVTQQTCSHCGECIVGCPKRAKTTLDLTYIPVALRHGAELRALCEVDAIDARPGEYRVHYLDRRDGRRYVVGAPRVVLSAGTLNTSRLLFRARDRDRTLPKVSCRLGERFSTNGDCAIWLGGALARACRAPSIEAWVLSNTGELPFAVAECGVPASALPSPFRENSARAVVLLGMGRDDSPATLRFDGRYLRTAANREGEGRVLDAIEEFQRALSTRYAAIATRRLLGPFDGAARLATVHPLGGACIGRSPEDGVVDHTGVVFGHPGLYVADGSLYPRAPGVPPSLTIAALAERQADLVV